MGDKMAQNSSGARVPLPPTVRGYAKFVVVAHPSDPSLLFTIGIRHVLDTVGARRYLRQLTNNCFRNYKWHLQASLCESFHPHPFSKPELAQISQIAPQAHTVFFEDSGYLADYTDDDKEALAATAAIPTVLQSLGSCPLGRKCSHMHITADGWAARRPWHRPPNEICPTTELVPAPQPMQPTPPTEPRWCNQCGNATCNKSEIGCEFVGAPPVPRRSLPFSGIYISQTPSQLPFSTNIPRVPFTIAKGPNSCPVQQSYPVQLPAHQPYHLPLPCPIEEQALCWERFPDVYVRHRDSDKMQRLLQTQAKESYYPCEVDETLLQLDIFADDQEAFEVVAYLQTAAPKVPNMYHDNTSNARFDPGRKGIKKARALEAGPVGK
eukprot:TRINITY_DN9999_c0_g1_i1.p1 TRINITY_DN9999_c0_g1~~TRINITY_DN9999_c0_g1_i1.p1  ORF type:complete len:388 (+),score=39.33 TRINITY_DN9999_c0_g1_i1:25-1164(+)